MVFSQIMIVNKKKKKPCRQSEIEIVVEKTTLTKKKKKIRQGFVAFLIKGEEARGKVVPFL